MSRQTISAALVTVGVTLAFGCASDSNDAGEDRAPAAGGDSSGATGTGSTSAVTGGEVPSGGAGPASGGAANGGTPAGGWGPTGGQGAGGTATGGVSIGGASTGGAVTGGAATGGRGIGGAGTGGVATGGMAAGGEEAGGASTGGGATGGGATGGEATGGEATGGEATGGEATGGEATGGEATGGEATGGEATGGEATGGEATGGASAGAVSSGGTGSELTPTHLPSATATCPTLESGMVSFLGSEVSLTVGPSGVAGPLLFYWHATGMTYTEVSTGFGDFMDEVESSGGVVASFTSTTRDGSNTGNAVWYTGDFAIADEVLACALEQGLVDPRRVHVSGYSAGGLQCGVMARLRSGYVASVLCMSGGLVQALSFTLDGFALQDPSYSPSAIAAHGAAGLDVIGVDFSACSAYFCGLVAADGGVAIDCDDGGDHLASMASRARTMGAVATRFFDENRWGAPADYAGGLPSYIPDYCALVE